MNFTHDLEMRASVAEREREATAIVRASEAVDGRGLRTGFAARLARLTSWCARGPRASSCRESSTNPSPLDRATNRISYRR